MAIKDLKIREGNVDIIVEVAEKAPVRQFEKFGKSGRVCNCKVKDETGEVSLTLWNDDIDKINVGDKIHIKNGYVGEWQGEPQLGTGKFGQLEVVGKSDAKPAAKKPAVVEEPMEEMGDEELDVEEEPVD